MNRKSRYSRIQFHRYCDYCKNHCEVTQPVESNYVMTTNIWNAKDKIERAFHRMSKQSVKPLVWLWIDDGSVDGSYEEILRVSKEFPELTIWVERMSKKKKGNLSTIGNAYTEHMPQFIKKLENYDIQYYTIQDVGTEPCPHYYEQIMSLMNEHPEIGASSGYMVGEEKARQSGMPMGDCKVTRWSIIKTIEKYWSLSPDTFVNIKTLKQGYKLKIWRVPVVQDEPSLGTSSSGMFYQGRLNYYVGRPFLGVLFRALRRFILRRYGTEMLRGYLFERKKGTWMCEDSDVLSFYGHGKSQLWILTNLIKTQGKVSD